MTVERFPVEAGHILMFARAVGDDNPIYSDPDHAATTEVGHVIAPPTFAQASAQFDPDYPLRPRIGKRWFGSGASASSAAASAQSSTGPDGERRDDERRDGGGGNAGGLHAEQHFEYHRHIGPGDVLTATTRNGATWEKQSRRAGKLMFSEQITEYRDQHGELVITARGVGVRTEKPVGS